MVMRDLYRFIGVNLTANIIEKIEDHFNAENTTILEKAFNTYRKSNFLNNNPDDIPMTIQHTVDKNCKNLLLMGNYTKL